MPNVEADKITEVQGGHSQKRCAKNSFESARQWQVGNMSVSDFENNSWKRQQSNNDSIQQYFSNAHSNKTIQLK